MKREGQGRGVALCLFTLKESERVRVSNLSYCGLRSGKWGIEWVRTQERELLMTVEGILLCV